MTVTRCVLKLFINGDEEFINKYKKHIDMHNYNLIKNKYADSGFDILQPDELTIPANEKSTPIDLNINCAMYNELYINKEPSSFSLISVLLGINILYWLNYSYFMIILALASTYLIQEQINYMTNSEFITTPSAFELHARSSLGSKSTIRLSNCEGIIDSGYRGNLIACVDNIGPLDYTANKFDRLFQVVAPSKCPIYIELVEQHSDLKPTERGSGGFGSTGK